jgi:uncharacterized metal-binding protein YceD (DUF177 family)
VSDVPAPEFSRPISMAEIGVGAVERTIEANEGERAALATRFDLLSLDRLSATLNLHREGETFMVHGRFSGAVTQACIASGDPVPAQIDEAMDVRFITDPEVAPNSELEVAIDECDTMFHDGRVIDLGEAVAQSLALALDPFPRSAKADALLKAAGVKAEEEAEAQALLAKDETNPFAALAGLRDKMGKE